MIKFLLTLIYGEALCKVTPRTNLFVRGFKHGAEAVINGLLESYSTRAQEQCWLYRFGFSLGVDNARRRA